MSREHSGGPMWPNSVFPRAAIIFAIVVCSSVLIYAADKTDIVTLVNGDRLTGEIVELDRGRLVFRTDSEGTIYIEWDKVVAGRGDAPVRGHHLGRTPIHRLPATFR